MSWSRANRLLMQVSPPEISNDEFHYFNDLKVDIQGAVAVVTMNRARQLNALCERLVAELRTALMILDQHLNIAVIVLAGLPRAFAAGADITEMVNSRFAQLRQPSHFVDALGCICDDMEKPVIAAVRGYALGGGLELAMMCDIIIAGESAKFGQPEIKIGTIPGAGGTQRLTRAVGKSKAMELVLTGRTMGAEEALKFGLVSKVVPDDRVLPEAIALAEEIAKLSKPVVAIAKESVNRSYESSLSEGLLYEKRAFQSTFALEDRREGMKAFVEKRKPAFKDK